MDTPKDVINDLLVDVFNNILSIENQSLKQRGIKLSMNEVHVLEAIEKTDDPSMTNLSRRLRVTVGTLTTAMNKLVEKGYVQRYREKEDKRKVLIRLTENCDPILKVHNQFHDEMISSIIEDMHLDHDDVLITSLTNIRDYFKNKY
jgi:DNA-binding MarR family transcriptional regulator